MAMKLFPLKARKLGRLICLPLNGDNLREGWIEALLWGVLVSCRSPEPRLQVQMLGSLALSLPAETSTVVILGTATGHL